MNIYYKIEDELARYKNFKADQLNEKEIGELKYNFKSEHTEIWVAAALKIGELAAQGNKELKYFLENKLVVIDRDSSNIHQNRHALTALGSFYGNNQGATRFTLMKEYSNNLDFDTIKVDLNDFFDNLFEKYKISVVIPEILSGKKNSLTGEDISLLKQELKKENLRKEVMMKKARALEGILNIEINTLYEINNYKELIIKLASKISSMKITEIKEALNYLKRVEHGFIDKIIEWYHQETIINNLTLDNFDLHQLKKKFEIHKIEQRCRNYPEKTGIKDWHLISLNFAIKEFYPLHKQELGYYLQGLINKSKIDCKYIINIPYFYLYLMKQVPGDFKNYQNIFDNMLNLIYNRDITLDYNNLFFSQVYLCTYEILKKAYPQRRDVQNIGQFIDLPQDVSAKYNNIKIENREIKIRQLIEDLKEYFQKDIVWQSFSKKKKNTILVFDLIIKDSELNLALEDEIEIILEEKDNWINKNQSLTQVFVRQLKYLYFNMIKKGNIKTTQIQFQIYSVLDLIYKWNWSGTIDKDIASILINAFDILWLKNNYSQLFKMLFTVYSQIPEGKVINEMHDYCKNNRLRQILKIYKDWNEKKEGLRETDYFKYLKEELQKFDYLPETLNKLYQNFLPEVMSLEVLYDDKMLNIFDVNNFLGTKDIEEKLETNILDLDILENLREGSNPLREYILSPVFRFELIMERNLLFDLLNNKINEFENEIEIQNKKKCTIYFNELTEILNLLKNTQKEFINAFDNEESFSKINTLGKNILNMLNQYQDLVNKYPYFERNYIFEMIDNARDNILKYSRYTSIIDNAIRKEREQELIVIIEERIYEWDISKELRRKFKNIVYNYFLERGMFTEYNKEILNNSGSKIYRGLAKINNIIIKPWLVVPMIFIPFIISLLINGMNINNSKLIFSVKIIYSSFSMIIQLFWWILLFFGIMYLIYKGCLRIKIIIESIIKKIKRKTIKHKKRQKNMKNSENPEYNKNKSSHIIYKFNFFLPKLIGVIFVTYLNFTLTDEFLVITHKINIYLKSILTLGFLVFLYYFLSAFQFGNQKTSSNLKRKRIWNTLTMGLTYSFTTNLLFIITYSGGMFLRSSTEISKIGKTVFKINFFDLIFNGKVPELIQVIERFFVTDIIIFPEIIPFWTVQMLFIAVILEYFLRKERIVK